MAETSGGGISLPESVDALKLWESEKSELERSRRVQEQLRAVLLPLQQRHGRRLGLSHRY